MRLAFLIAFENSPYVGVVKPFLEWAKSMKENSLIILFSCSQPLISFVEEDAKAYGFATIITNNLEEISSELRNHNIEYLVGDDYLPRLEIMLGLAKITRVEVVVYALVLYGTSSIFRTHHTTLLDFRSKLTYKASSVIPFALLTRRYRKLLSQAKKVMAVSKFTAQLLYALYGIQSTGVVYPPIDTHIFKPVKDGGYTNNSALVYLGSNAGDTNPALIKKIIGKMEAYTDKIHTFGNRRLYDGISNITKIEYHSGLTNLQLARLYSDVRLTIAPQTIELFGLVPVESLSCGTPVLTSYPHEFADSSVGHISYHDEDLIQHAKLMLKSEITDDVRIRCRESILGLSIDSTKSILLQTLEKDENYTRS